MRRVLTTLLATITVATALASAAVPSSAAGPAATPRYVPCNTAAAGRAQCMSIVRSNAGHPKSRSTEAGSTAIPGLKAADIPAAYGLPKTGGKNQTVAIVDAYDNPNVEKDLKVYRATNKLPPCTTANKCFRKVDQHGGKAYPLGDPGWGVEIALDVQAVSAACPGCHILLVEADDSSFENLGTAVNTAVRLGAAVVSNSYGGAESSLDADMAKRYYTHPNVPILASSGDAGFTVAYSPAVLANVWAVGGTLLNPVKGGGYTETAWQYAGSARSAYVTKPVGQKDRNCAMRTVSDVSAAADSKDGFAVYDTYGVDDPTLGLIVIDNWVSVSGTSLSSPLVAGMIGLAGNAATVADPSYLYAHRSGLKDVVGGSNGYCGKDYLCTGVKGYDGPTGLGSPRGLGSL